MLSASNEARLLALERKLIDADIPHKAIREPDPPWDGQLMAIGIKPMPRKLARKFVSNLPLLKELNHAGND